MTSKRPRHGTITRWVRHRCRCTRCEAAWQRYRDHMYAHRDPARFGPAAQDRFLKLVSGGATLKAAAAQCGVSSSTISLLARSRPRFRTDLDAALDTSRRHRRQGPRPSTRRRPRAGFADQAAAAGYDSPEAAIKATATMTVDVTARQLGVSISTVHRWRTRLGVEAGVPTWWHTAGYASAEAAIKATAEATLADAARQLGIGVTTVFSHRVAAGLDTKSHQPRRPKVSLRRRAAAAGYGSAEAAIRATAGATLVDAARQLGVEVSTIRYWRRHFGLATQIRWWTTAGYATAEAAIRATAHLTMRDAGARLGLARSPLYRWRKRFGLTTPRTAT